RPPRVIFARKPLVFNGADLRDAYIARYFSTTLTGQGTATLKLHFDGTFNGVSAYSFESLTFEFQDPTAVPEPMTITLVATGLVGLGANLRRRAKRRTR
ncbi:MAG TPA: PEP-CTERM sorting domain-containing protein, partial [Pyrinomonadaceae bacterium]|nr:PEP-CTERM sorting domain-containing protein [Pyrinomonadaceae bacterium]